MSMNRSRSCRRVRRSVVAQRSCPRPA
jgi:hypothetical protein